MGAAILTRALTGVNMAVPDAERQSGRSTGLPRRLLKNGLPAPSKDGLATNQPRECLIHGSESGHVPDLRLQERTGPAFSPGCHATATTPPMTDTPANDHDFLSRFMLLRPGVRGAVVRLDQTWASIRGRADLPPAVARCLGETCAAAALFTSHIKMEGRLSVQMRGSGTLRRLFAECTTAGTLRGIAHHDGPTPERMGPRAFGQDAMLAISIENLPPGAREVHRYQGIVGLDADSLSEAFEDYFRQSEQLPTRIRLVGGESRAAAMMIQQLPDGHGDPDGWTRASALFATLTDLELLDLSTESLVWRLFHEESPQWLEGKALSFACSCSRGRVADMLHTLGPDEALAAAEDGDARVHCDFCGQEYIFGREEIRALFSHGPEAPGPTSLQ